MPVTDPDTARRAEISRQAAALNERLVAIRRDIHAHPEVGHHEHRTTAVIVDELERAGLVVKVLPVGTGAYCDVLPNGFDDSAGLVGLRADIDALPIQDGKDVPYALQEPAGSVTPAGTTCTPRSCSASAWCSLGCGRRIC